MTYRELLEDALRGLNVIDAEQVAQAADEAYLLRIFNRIQDSWNAHDLFAYVLAEQNYTLTPNLNPHTIGASGTFTATRPEDIEAAAIVSGSIVYPLTLRDLAWWQQITDPSLTSEIPSHLVYNPTYPNGSLYLWPKPSAAVTLRLWVRQPFTAVTDAASTFSLPPGYQDALTLTLAEYAGPSFGAQVPPEVRQQAVEARALLARSNARPAVSVQTARPGMPGWASGGWDYRVGMLR